jgi:hypothetical protein
MWSGGAAEVLDSFLIAYPLGGLDRYMILRSSTNAELVWQMEGMAGAQLRRRGEWAASNCGMSGRD